MKEEKIKALELTLLILEAYRMVVISTKGRAAPILEKLDKINPIIHSIIEDITHEKI